VSSENSERQESLAAVLRVMGCTKRVSDWLASVILVMEEEGVGWDLETHNDGSIGIRIRKNSQDSCKSIKWETPNPTTRAYEMLRRLRK
jgi:hypothetical protein